MIRMLLVFIVLCMGSLSACAEIQKNIAVTFFGSNQFQPKNVEWAQHQPGINLLIINLDDHQKLERELALNLPLNDSDRAVAIATQRVAAVPQSHWDRLFVGQMKARQWGINRYPAVVFGDGDHVVYGVTDLQEAIERWRANGGAVK